MNQKSEIFFETIKCFEGEPYHLDFHEKRIAKTIGKNFNLNDYIYPINDELLKCKVIYDMDQILDVTYDSYVEKDQKIFKIIEANNLQYNSKFLYRDAINHLVNFKEDADDIIIVKNGYVTDTSIANIAIKKNDKWFTPQNPLLEGTTKNRLCDEGFLKSYPIRLDDLLQTKEFAIMNAMIGFKEVKNFLFKI